MLKPNPMDVTLHRYNTLVQSSRTFQFRNHMLQRAYQSKSIFQLPLVPSLPNCGQNLFYHTLHYAKQLEDSLSFLAFSKLIEFVSVPYSCFPPQPTQSAIFECLKEFFYDNSIYILIELSCK